MHSWELLQSPNAHLLMPECLNGGTAAWSHLPTKISVLHRTVRGILHTARSLNKSLFPEEVDILERFPFHLFETTIRFPCGKCVAVKFGLGLTATEQTSLKRRVTFLAIFNSASMREL